MVTTHSSSAPSSARSRQFSGSFFLCCGGSQHTWDLWNAVYTTSGGGRFEDVEKYKKHHEYRVSSLSSLSTPQFSVPFLMIAAAGSSKDHSKLLFKPMKMDFGVRYLVDASKHDSLTDTFNTGHCSPPTASIIDLPSLARSRFIMQLGRVATVNRHDTDAWTREREAHDSELNAAAVPSPSLSSKDNTFALEVATRSFAPMELPTERSRTIEQFLNAGRLCEDIAAHPYDWTTLVTPCLGVSPVRPNVTTGPCAGEDLSRGQRQVGEILLRCGVFGDSEVSPMESTTSGCSRNIDVCTVIAPVLPNVTIEPGSGDDERLITALADWTTDWVHELVIQPYLQGTFRFRYQGSPSGVSTSVASRIRRLLDNVENPVQVAIHSLFFISTLTRNNAHKSAPFLSVPIFRYLHNNGTFTVEDFMFRTFVTCAMIGDKTVNDVTLTTNTWNRLTRMPQIILNTTEKYALSCLEWNVVMTRTQWQDTIVHLRSCIKMSSAFDPFSYVANSPSSIMARHLDKLINLGHAIETYASRKELPAVEILSPQPVRHFTHWEVFTASAAEWCPEDDPVINERPRTIGIAPGPDQNSRIPGTTAKDLLDSILGSRNIPHLVHLAQPAGTSFCGSFGVIGARLAHTIKIASACQSAWVPSHG